MNKKEHANRLNHRKIAIKKAFFLGCTGKRPFLFVKMDMENREKYKTVGKMTCQKGLKKDKWSFLRNIVINVNRL